MAEKFQIIARYTEGNAKFWIGRKIDPDRPLDETNVEWKKKNDSPVIFSQYSDAEKSLLS